MSPPAPLPVVSRSPPLEQGCTAPLCDTKWVTSRLCLQDPDPVLSGCAQNMGTSLKEEPVGMCRAPLTLGHASSVIAGAGACGCIKALEETLLWQCQPVSLHNG